MDNYANYYDFNNNQSLQKTRKVQNIFQSIEREQSGNMHQTAADRLETHCIGTLKEEEQAAVDSLLDEILNNFNDGFDDVVDKAELEEYIYVISV